MKPLPHIILETANFHGGDPEKLKKLINQFSELKYDRLAIKFHAHKYNCVALSDFSWYEASKSFFINDREWENIINLSHEKGFNVWMDLFCVYGVSVVSHNLDKIFGLKLQPSILDNHEIIQELLKLDLSDKEFIINVSGLELSDIENYLKKFRKFNVKKIIIQTGFQSYPTRIEDTSLSKLDILKAAFFESEFSFADHIAAHEHFSQTFPVYAYLNGCNYLEKHVCNSRKETQYDMDSALELNEIKNIISEITHVNSCFDTDFISGSELKYYQKTLQKPVLKQKINRGQLVADSDVLFRRTDKLGMNIRDLKALQKNFYILDKDRNDLDTVSVKHYKKARIGVIVAVRMKSSRLKQKAILPIKGIPSIERCLMNCLKFPYMDDVILATSTLKEDGVLKRNTLNGKIKFWQGDPDDVISRYLGACAEYNIDVIVRLTGDSPVVSPEIAGILLESHFKTGADFSEAQGFPIGTNCQIYNVEALKRVIGYVGKADYSEHMTLYMTNNQSLFKVNYVELPEELRKNVRLTLDYPEDLEMFNELFAKLEEEGLNSNLIDVIKAIDKYPHIAKINENRSQLYHTDQKLIKLLNEKTTIKNIKR